MLDFSRETPYGYYQANKNVYRSTFAPSDEPPKRKRGRPKGSKNRATLIVRELAQKHGAKAVTRLVKLMTESKDEKIQHAAAVELLDRAYGRPTQTNEFSGPEGAPLQSEVTVSSPTEIGLALAARLSGL